MSKIYKSYATACRLTTGAVDAVTLDGVEGFMERQYTRGCEEVAHDTASWMTGAVRHLVVVALPGGLFGAYWFDGEAPARPVAQTLFSTSAAALEDHAKLVASYRRNPVWCA